MFQLLCWSLRGYLMTFCPRRAPGASKHFFVFGRNRCAADAWSARASVAASVVRIVKIEGPIDPQPYLSTPKNKPKGLKALFKGSLAKRKSLLLTENNCYPQGLSMSSASSHAFVQHAMLPFCPLSVFLGLPNMFRYHIFPTCTLW